jgi:hypothetical protein
MIHEYTRFLEMSRKKFLMNIFERKSRPSPYSR